MELNKPNQNILANINKFVKEELDKDNIPQDTKLVVVGTVDNNGARIVANVLVKRSDKFETKIAAIFDHDWDGDDTAGVKVIFTGK